MLLASMIVAVEKTAIPTSAYSTVSDLPKDGFYIDRAMTKSQMVLQTDILTKDLVMDKYKAGYEITSFAAESFDDSVNGSLRKGDMRDGEDDPTTILNRCDLSQYKLSITWKGAEG